MTKGQLPDKIKKLIGKLFQVDDEIIYYAEYSDGCTYVRTRSGAEQWEGKEHSPHIKFYPNDKPVKEWGK